MKTNKNVSIVILSCNTREITNESVKKAIVSSKYYAKKTGNNTEIIVIDNASTDGTREILKQFSTQIRSYFFSKNEGVSKGYNKGMHLSKYQYILLINNDTYLYEKTILDSVTWMSSHPLADVVIGKLIDRNGYFGSYGGSLPTPANTIRLFLGIDFVPFLKGRINRIYRMGEKFDRELELGWAPSCFLFMRREVYQKTGGHDENLFFYMDDVEWCKRIVDGGFHIWFTPKIKATHLGGQSSYEKWKLTQILQRQINGMIYYHRKHYPRWFPTVRFFMWLGLRLRAIYFLVTRSRVKAVAHLAVKV